MKIRYVMPALAATAVLVLAGCTNSEAGVQTSSPAEGVKPDNAAVALLPDNVRKSGVLRIGGDLGAPPSDYKDPNGNPTGWGVQLTYAVAAKLGLKPEWQVLQFPSILPRIQEGDVDLGSASFTDTLERQKAVDFVNYLIAGTQWAAPTGTDVDPDNACGLTVAVAQGTIQYSDELPARSTKCVSEGRAAINVLPFPNNSEAFSAVIQGRANAMTADSTATGDAVAKSTGALHEVGKVYDAAPFGFATQKGSGTTKAVQAALQSLMDDGSYDSILKAANVSGVLTQATINAGKK